MAEEMPPQQDPEPVQDQDQEEEERLFTRMRGVVREELEEHGKRQKPEEPKPPTAAKPEITPEPKKDDDKPSTPTRPRRTAADVWFGRRR